VQSHLNVLLKRLFLRQSTKISKLIPTTSLALIVLFTTDALCSVEQVPNFYIRGFQIMTPQTAGQTDVGHEERHIMKTPSYLDGLQISKSSFPESATLGTGI
jgi:hypothetical protein